MGVRFHVWFCYKMLKINAIQSGDIWRPISVVLNITGYNVFNSNLEMCNFMIKSHKRDLYFI